LIAIQWWNWDMEKIVSAYDAIMNSNITVLEKY
ncbi:MAG: hypothetical protein K0R94_1394, partial [Burkholderiales bacterium]|nr:hypothetical protein [Burkholderiales bacterium]